MHLLYVSKKKTFYKHASHIKAKSINRVSVCTSWVSSQCVQLLHSSKQTNGVFDGPGDSIIADISEKTKIDILKDIRNITSVAKETHMTSPVAADASDSHTRQGSYTFWPVDFHDFSMTLNQISTTKLKSRYKDEQFRKCCAFLSVFL